LYAIGSSAPQLRMAADGLLSLGFRMSPLPTAI
jgi:hypothetical protein